MAHGLHCRHSTVLRSTTSLVAIAAGVLITGASGCERSDCVEERQVATARGVSEECITIEDAAAAAAVRRQLAGTPELDATKMRVSVISGVATLSGEANDERDAKRAEKIAYAVDGVERVKNDILVVRPPVNPRTLSDPGTP